MAQHSVPPPSISAQGPSPHYSSAQGDPPRTQHCEPPLPKLSIGSHPPHSSAQGPSQNSIQHASPPGAQHSASHSSQLSSLPPPELRTVFPSSVRAPPSPPLQTARPRSGAAVAEESETRGAKGGAWGGTLPKKSSVQTARFPGQERRPAALPAAPPVRPRTALFKHVGTARQ